MYYKIVKDTITKIIKNIRTCLTYIFINYLIITLIN